MENTHASLEQRFRKLSTEVERLLGRKDEATRNLEALRASCLAKGIDPENLQAHIDTAKQELEAATAELVVDLEKAEKDLLEILAQLKETP